ncbi:MFS-type drug efflux transporter P55 [Cedecea lapagei]|uniref:MFS-type drug efflux transporter P55 n=1 Tax=Cedecea lapagei TaxID=158823 RepID=A0A3S4IRG2_9ENTR|nr:MFS transporter [Cedecea lapagei]VEC01517.1 MFS-type drug efflux transporter P55 [Cedecea lapagei]
MKLTSPISMYRGLPKDIYFIALAKFVLGLGNFIIPFMILLLTQKLGYSTAVAGSLAMGVTGLYLMGNLIGGKLSDAYGHKQVMLWGEALGAFILIISGFFADWHIAIPAMLFISYLFFGIALPASNALVADLSSPANRSAVMSLSYLTYNLGSGIGPVLAGYLFWDHTAWIFWGNGLAGMLGVFIVLFFVTNKKMDNNFSQNEHSAREQAIDGTVWQVFRQRPYLIIFGVLCTLLWISLQQLTMTTPLYLSHLFGKQGPILYGQLMTFASLLVVIITPLIIRLTARTEEAKSLAIAGFLFALGYLLVVADKSVGMQFLAWSILTAGEVLLLTKEGVYLANHSPSSHRGRISGVLSTMRNVGLMPMYAVMGAYIGIFGYLSTWLLIVGLSFITGILLLLFSARQRRIHFQM